MSNAIGLVGGESWNKFPECESLDLHNFMEQFLSESRNDVFCSDDDEPLLVEDLVANGYKLAKDFLKKIEGTSCPLVVVWNRPRNVSYLLPNWKYFSKNGSEVEGVVLANVIATELAAVSRALIEPEVFVCCRDEKDVHWLKQDNMNPRSSSFSEEPCGPLHYLQGQYPKVGLSAVNLAERRSMSVCDYRHQD